MLWKKHEMRAPSIIIVMCFSETVLYIGEGKILKGSHRMAINI